MFKKFSFIFLAALISIAANAQVRVTKTAKGYNPTVKYNGNSKDKVISTQIASDLKKCGWFNVTNGADCDYNISTAYSGTKLRVSVTGKMNFSFTVPVDEKRKTASAHAAVDYILKKIFNINGICSSRIVFCAETSKGKKEIYVCDFDGKNLKKLTKNKTSSVEPDWVPGKKRIVYTLRGKTTTAIIEFDTPSRKSRRLTKYKKGTTSAASVSPNGKVLALILSIDNMVDLYLTSVNGSSTLRLTKNRSVEASPCWSPQGGKLCYVSDSNGRPSLYVIAAKGGKARKLTTMGSEAQTPDWSHGNKICYSCRMGRNYAIAVLDLTGKEKAAVITKAAGDWESPSWAPDGRHIICSRTLNKKSTLYLIDSWTGKARQLLGGGANLTQPSWGNNGK